MIFTKKKTIGPVLGLSYDILCTLTEQEATKLSAIKFEGQNNLLSLRLFWEDLLNKIVIHWNCRLLMLVNQESLKHLFINILQ